MSTPINGLDDLRVLLRDERIRRRISQADIPGVGRTTVLAFENGSEGVRADTVFALMNALGCRISVEFGPPEPAADDEIDLGGGPTP